MDNSIIVIAALVGLAGFAFFAIGFILFITRKSIAEDYNKQRNADTFPVKELIGYLEDRGVELCIIPGAVKTGIRYHGTTFRISNWDKFKKNLAHTYEFVLPYDDVDQVLYFENFLKKKLDEAVFQVHAAYEGEGIKNEYE